MGCEWHTEERLIEYTYRSPFYPNQRETHTTRHAIPVNKSDYPRHQRMRYQPHRTDLAATRTISRPDHNHTLRLLTHIHTLNYGDPTHPSFVKHSYSHSRSLKKKKNLSCCCPSSRLGLKPPTASHSFSSQTNVACGGAMRSSRPFISFLDPFHHHHHRRFLSLLPLG